MSLPDKDPFDLFKRSHFASAIVILCVRWYLTYEVSYRDLVAIMAERNVDVAHTPILRGVQHYVLEFEKCRQRYVRPIGTAWRVDEIYLKVKDKWIYVYRVVDRAGPAVY